MLRSVRMSITVFESIPFTGWRRARVAVSNAFHRGQHGRLCPHQDAISGVHIASPRDTLFCVVLYIMPEQTVNSFLFT